MQIKTDFDISNFTRMHNEGFTSLEISKLYNIDTVYVDKCLKSNKPIVTIPNNSTITKVSFEEKIELNNAVYGKDNWHFCTADELYKLMIKVNN